MTSRQQKRTALLQSLKECKRQQVGKLTALGLCDPPEQFETQSREIGTCPLGDRRHLVYSKQDASRAHKQYSMLGQRLCQTSFKCFSGIGGSFL